MKCYYDQTHCHFLDYFNDPIMDDAVIYIDNIPLQYNKIEGRYTEFIGNPIGTGKRDHEFLIVQRRNRPNISSDLINFGLHITKNIVVILYKYQLQIPLTHHNSHIML